MTIEQDPQIVEVESVDDLATAISRNTFDGIYQGADGVKIQQEDIAELWHSLVTYNHLDDPQLNYSFIPKELAVEAKITRGEKPGVPRLPVEFHDDFKRLVMEEWKMKSSTQRQNLF